MKQSEEFKEEKQRLIKIQKSEDKNIKIGKET